MPDLRSPELHAGSDTASGRRNRLNPLGETGISVENLQVVCDALQISLRQFFAGPEGDIRQEDRLLIQIGKLTDGQRKALTDFLEALLHQD